MITELGHFALILALTVAVGADDRAGVGRAEARPRLMAFAEPAALSQFVLMLLAFLALMHAYVVSDFSVANVAINSPSDQAAALSHLRRVGEPRGLDAAVGADPGAVRRRGRRSSAATCRRRSKPTCSSVQGSIALAFLLFILADVEPLHAARSGAGRRQAA